MDGMRGDGEREVLDEWTVRERDVGWVESVGGRCWMDAGWMRDVGCVGDVRGRSWKDAGCV